MKKVLKLKSISSKSKLATDINSIKWVILCSVSVLSQRIVGLHFSVQAWNSFIVGYGLDLGNGEVIWWEKPSKASCKEFSSGEKAEANAGQIAHTACNHRGSGHRSNVSPQNVLVLLFLWLFKQGMHLIHGIYDLIIAKRRKWRAAPVGAEEEKTVVQWEENCIPNNLCMFCIKLPQEGLWGLTRTSPV